MSFPRHAKYMDSGVDWLGQVPQHWRVAPLKSVSTLPSTLFIDGDWIESKDLSDEGVRYITTGNIGEGRYREQGSGYITPEKFAELDCTEVAPGDVLISRLNPPIGRSCLAPNTGERLVTSVDNVIARPNAEFSRAFLVYMLSSKQHFANMENLARGTTMQRIGRTALGNVRFAFPPESEQHRIAAFLDRETGRIDALVEEQRRLVELLKEKRQAVISRAVTKGLAPNVPMKDSGGRWLGEVPAHWTVAPIKTFGWLKGGAGFPHEEQGVNGEELNFYKVAALGGDRSSGVIDHAEHTISRSTAERLGACIFPGGTVVFAKVGAALLLGRVRLLPADACIDNNMMGIVPCESTHGEFLRLAMSLVRFDLISNPGAVPSLNEGQIGNFPLAKPPIDEQRVIASFLRGETARIDSLTSEAQRGVEFLLERRSALISAAVTGKIDVRGLVLQPEAVAA